MIIFDLDGTLADCEHRLHFVDPTKDPNAMQDIFSSYADGRWWDLKVYEESSTAQEWKPDWKAFYEACDQDKPIKQVIEIWNDKISLGLMGVHQIWSGRCESTRLKTEQWLMTHTSYFGWIKLKMRPIGDNITNEALKEHWLDEIIAKDETIDCVFDSHGPSIEMWHRRGIFVFNCFQGN